jgi:hypothetical protein
MPGVVLRAQDARRHALLHVAFVALQHYSSPAFAAAACAVKRAPFTVHHWQLQEYFERAAAVYIDLPGSSKVPEGPSTAAYEEADEDMFASDEERKEPQAAAAAAAGAAAAVGAGSGTVQQLAPSAGGPPAAGGPPQAASGPPAKAAAADATDYSSWPVKELRRFLAERGVVSERGLAVGACLVWEIQCSCHALVTLLARIAVCNLQTPCAAAGCRMARGLWTRQI